MASFTQPVNVSELVQRLLEQGVEATINRCGAEFCGHRGGEHALDNRCLVCDCSHFSSRDMASDLLIALKLAGLIVPASRDTTEIRGAHVPSVAKAKHALICACGCGELTRGGTFKRGLWLPR